MPDYREEVTAAGACVDPAPPSFDSALVFHHLQTFIKGPLILENSIMASKMDKLAAGAEKLTRFNLEIFHFQISKNVLILRMFDY